MILSYASFQVWAAPLNILLPIAYDENFSLAWTNLKGQVGALVPQMRKCLNYILKSFQDQIIVSHLFFSFSLFLQENWLLKD